MGRDYRDSFETLVHQRIPHIRAHIIRLLDYHIECLVHLFRRFFVVNAEVGEDFENLGLDPWTRHPMIIKVPRQSMINHLLQNDQHRIDQPRKFASIATQPRC